MAMRDNADAVDTLYSVRANEGYQLVAQLGRAYDDLAGYLRGLAE